MRARLWYRFDLLVATGLGLTATAAAALLIADVYLFAREPTATPVASVVVATLTRAENQVRHRPADLPLWASADLKQQLFLKDAVFTDKVSTAELAFADGSRVELGESTLVAIENVEKKPVLNVVRGSLRAAATNRGEGPLIRVGKQGALLRPGEGSDLKIDVAADGTAQVAVLRGTARVMPTAQHDDNASAKNDSGLTLSTDQAVELAASGATRLRSLPLRLSAPAHAAAIALNAGEGVRLEWQAPTAQPPYVVEIARDQGFRRLVAQRTTSATTVVSQALKPGVYWWRVRSGTAADATLSEERRFDISAAGAPALFRPLDGAVVGEDGATIELLWGAAPGVEYRVELARDERLAVAADTSGGSYRTGALAAGRYAWRVHALTGDQGWSAVGRFTIAERRPDAVTASDVHRGGSLPQPMAIPSATPPAPPTQPIASPTSGLALTGLAPSSEPAPPPVEEAPATPDPTPAEPLVAAATSLDGAAATARDASPAEPVTLQSARQNSATPESAKPVSTTPTSTQTVTPAALSTATSTSTAMSPSPPLPASRPPQPPMAAPSSRPAPVKAKSRHPSLSVALGPLSWLDIAYAPSIFAYSTHRGGTETEIDALLFNSLAAAGSIWLDRSWAIDASFLRTATVLFRQLDADDPPEQLPLIVQPFSLAGEARRRLLGDERLFLDARAGYGVDNVVSFTRHDGGTISVRHALVHGPAIGGAAGLRLSRQWRLRGHADYVVGVLSPAGRIERSRLLTLSGALTQRPMALPVAVVYGYAWRLQELTLDTGDAGELRAGARTYSLLLGAELQFDGTGWD